MILYCDTETYSSINLFTHGVSAYAESPDAEVMLWAYAIDDGEIEVWDRTTGAPMPLVLEEALALADEHVWQNFFFDYTMIATTMGIELPVEKTWDTMVQAMAHGLPGKLDQLCDIFRLGEDAKHKRGRELINLFCKPPAKNLKRGRATRHTHPEDWAAFIEYAKSDIRSMRRLRKLIPTWNYNRQPANRVTEHQLWQLDQKINRRGVQMDLELAAAALKAVGDNKKALDAQVEEWTGGDVASANQRDKLLKHILAEYDIDLPDLKGATLERRVKDESLPQGVRDLLAMRMETATSSTSKYKKLQQVVSQDGRARGLLQFNGAARTRRDGGRLWQPQNLPRPNMDGEAIEEGIDLLKRRLAHLVCEPVSVQGVKSAKLHQVSIPKLASNALRGSIIAAPGKKLVVADLKSIEGVNGAWLCDEHWKVQAYEDIFTGRTKFDMYLQAYARSFGITDLAIITKAQRQLGKIQELALMYEGGVGAFVTFVLTYRMDLDEVTRAVLETIAADVYRAAEEMLAWRKSKRMTTYGLPDETFIACEALKALWRDAHPATKSYWPELADAMIRAIRGETVEARHIIFDKKGTWIRALLPSGNYLCYPDAQVENQYTRQDGLQAGKITYMGVSPISHQWKRIGTYGGKILENADQGFSRDVLFYQMPHVEAAGYEIIMRVHDELITEAPDSPEFTVARLCSLITDKSTLHFDTGPLAADGFETYTYKKED